MIDLSWTDEQLAFKKAVIDFAQKELSTGILERDRAGEISLENWRKCAQFGLLGLALPEEYGGSGVDVLTAMLVMEGLGYGCRDNGLIFAMNAQMWSVQHPIYTFGTDDQKRKYLPGLIAGTKMGCFGLTEPDHGSDPGSMITKAAKVDGGYLLSGSKTWISNAPIADDQHARPLLACQLPQHAENVLIESVRGLELSLAGGLREVGYYSFGVQQVQQAPPVDVVIGRRPRCKP